MALYVITRTDRTDYDEYDKIVVRAGSEKEALALVCQANPSYPQDELYPGFRIDGSNSQAEKIPATGGAEVIVSVFRAG